MVGVCSYPISDANMGIEQGGFEFTTDNYIDLMNRDDIDIIDICTPNFLHKEIMISALNAGKHINIEKPLAMNLSEAKTLLNAANAHPELISQICFEYRYTPAIIRAKQLIEEGFLGKVWSVRAVYLRKSDNKGPVNWKVQKQYCGGGSLYDLASHLIDLIRFLLGYFKKIFSKLETFTKERPAASGSNEMYKVDVDDLALLLFEMENGAVRTIESNRVATGTNNEVRIEIHGEKGAIRFNSMQPNFLYVYDMRDEVEPIGGRRGYNALETVQRYPKPAANFPGSTFPIGWIRAHSGNAYDFIKNIVERTKPILDIRAGYKVQEVIEAASISDAAKKWVDLPL